MTLYNEFQFPVRLRLRALLDLILEQTEPAHKNWSELTENLLALIAEAEQCHLRQDWKALGDRIDNLAENAGFRERLDERQAALDQEQAQMPQFGKIKGTRDSSSRNFEPLGTLLKSLRKVIQRSTPLTPLATWPKIEHPNSVVAGARFRIEAWIDLGPHGSTDPPVVLEHSPNDPVEVEVLLSSLQEKGLESTTTQRGFLEVNDKRCSARLQFGMRATSTGQYKIEVAFCVRGLERAVLRSTIQVLSRKPGQMEEKPITLTGTVYPPKKTATAPLVLRVWIDKSTAESQVCHISLRDTASNNPVYPKGTIHLSHQLSDLLLETGRILNQAKELNNAQAQELRLQSLGEHLSECLLPQEVAAALAERPAGYPLPLLSR